MSENQKKVVPTAETKEPAKETKPEEIEVSLPFDIDPKTIKRAEGLGIPITAMLQWMATIEYDRIQTAQKFEILAKGLEKAPAEVARILTEQAKEAREKRVRAQVETEPQQGRSRGDWAEFGQMMREAGIIGGGSGLDEDMLKMQKEMMGLNILRMKKDMEFTDTIKNAIAVKIAGKAAAEIIG